MLKSLAVTVMLLAGMTAAAQLPLPPIPNTLTTPIDRANYLAMHFYDAMDWNDPVMTTEENVMQDWANFLSVLPHCNPVVRNSAITKCIHAIPAEMISKYAELADGYLFATDSELCNETNYLTTLQALCSHPGISDKNKSVLEPRLEYLSRCAPGTTAIDITVELLKDDTTARLSELKNKAHNILLVFYDPDCEDCHETLHELMTEKKWNDAQDSGLLLVVKAEITDETDALYPILNVPSLYHLTGDHLEIVARNIPLTQLALKEVLNVWINNEITPMYPGGDKALESFINENLKYPDSALKDRTEGTVIIHFTIKMDGTIGNIKVVRGINEDLDNEAIRVVKLMPDFIPGGIAGKPANIGFTIPFRFKLPQ